MSHSKNIFTQAVHAGERLPKPDYQPMSTPIHPAVGFVYDDIETLDAVLDDTREGYVYRRYANPTVNAFEQAMAQLEQGEAAYATGSGMAAIHGALLAAGVAEGEHILAAQDCYGATYSMVTQYFYKMGVSYTLADFNNLDKLRAIMEHHPPTVLICETMSNPLLRLVDIPAVAKLAHRYEATLIVDSTFSTPYLSQPLTQGADYVLHSATKYIGGHDDILAGVVVTSAENRHELYQIEKMVGANLSPFEAWLGLRGLKTLPLRMQQHCKNAMQVAQWLENHPKVARVYYPGLPSHPQHALAKKLYGTLGFGGMLAFDIADATAPDVFKFMNTLKLIQTATTLGDVYSIAVYPAQSSHRALPPAERRKIGIGDGLVRLSVGIEATEDIIADLEQALA